MRILIQNGEIVTAADRFPADLLIEGETIAAIGRNLPSEGTDRVYDARGKYVIPGGIDAHCHLELPFMGTVSRDDFFTGTRAAVAGGTTCLIDFCIPARGESMKSALETWDAKSQGKACCDYSYHMAVTSWGEERRQELDLAFERGITSFKVFMAYKGVLMLADDEIFDLMLEVKRRGGLVTAHAVNGDVLNVLAARYAAEGKLTPAYHPLCQPAVAEGEATGRFLELGGIAGQSACVVHMTAAQAVEELARARARGWASFGETCPQYLVLDDSLYNLPGFEGAKYVLSPPLRKRHDQEALWGALANGIVQTVGTDHCTFDFHGQKDMGRDDFRKIPNGFNGLEERLSVLYTHGVKKGRITLNRWVEVCCTNPAKMFNLYPRKGSLAVGSDADVVIWDPERRYTISARTHHSACDYNVYEGFEMEGGPSQVFVRGLLSYEEGRFVGTEGHGRFLSRPAGPPRLLRDPAQPEPAAV